MTQNLNEQLNAVLENCKHLPEGQIPAQGSPNLVCKTCAITWGKSLEAQSAKDFCAGLFSTLTPCWECDQPATYCTETAELGYYLYHCDEHKKPLSAGYGETNPPKELKTAALVRDVKKFLEQNT